jgi:hypothetical protein
MTTPNNGQFQKSNWTRGLECTAKQYLPSAKGGIANPTTVAPNVVLTTTVNAAFRFQGNGPLDLTLPFGQQILNSATVAATTISLGESWLTGAIGATGYASGVHPTITYKLANVGTATQTLIGCDLVASQF